MLLYLNCVETLSDLGLHCLPMSYKRDARLTWVNHLPYRDPFLTCLQTEKTRVYSIAYRRMIRYDPTLVDLTSNLFVLITNMKIYLYNNYS